MISEQFARAATDSPELRLENFDEFVGVGVVPDERTEDMVVAVYVSKPIYRLSKLFRESVPKSIPIEMHGRRVRVSTKFVNVGEVVASEQASMGF